MATASWSASSSQTLPRIVTLSEIEAIVSTPSFAVELVDAIRDGFARQDDFYMAPIQTLGCPPASPPFSSTSDDTNSSIYCAQTCVKTGYFVGGEHYVIKVASGGHPFPSNSGLVQVYSQRTGRLDALLLDEGMLTELRTAAVGVLAYQLFAPRSVHCVGVLGCGVQARYQLRMLGQVMCDHNRADEETPQGTCRNTLVYGRDPEKLAAYVDEVKECGWTVNVTTDPSELLHECDVIITTTSSRTALLTMPPAAASSSSAAANRPLKTRLFVCIGSDAPGKSELEDSILMQPDVVRVADSVQQSRERGEFQALAPDLPIVSLKEVLLDPSQQQWRRKSRRKSRPEGNDGSVDDDGRVVVFDSSGLALQDCVIAELVCRALELCRGGET